MKLELLKRNYLCRIFFLFHRPEGSSSVFTSLNAMGKTSFIYLNIVKYIYYKIHSRTRLKICRLKMKSKEFVSKEGFAIIAFI